METNILKAILGGILTGATYFLGGWDIALQTLIVFVVIDYLTGMLRAGYHGKLNSKVGLKGIIKKIMYLCVVVLAFYMDNMTAAKGWIRNATIYFFIANEGLSVVENYASCCLPFPEFLKEKLEQLKGSGIKEKERK